MAIKPFHDPRIPSDREPFTGPWRCDSECTKVMRKAKVGSIQIKTVDRATLRIDQTPPPHLPVEIENEITFATNYSRVKPGTRKRVYDIEANPPGKIPESPALKLYQDLTYLGQRAPSEEIPCPLLCDCRIEEGTQPDVQNDWQEGIFEQELEYEEVVDTGRLFVQWPNVIHILNHFNRPITYDPETDILRKTRRPSEYEVVRRYLALFKGEVQFKDSTYNGVCYDFDDDA